MSKAFSRNYGACPHCSAGIGTHEFIELGSAPIEDEGSLSAKLTQAINERDWSTALSIHESASADAAILFRAFRCPITGAGLLVGEEWFGTYDPLVIRSELLSVDSIKEISKFASSEWSTTKAVIARMKSNA